jgi:predicted RNA binding protein YcfA (HicA-like mRNA interferase family)
MSKLKLLTAKELEKIVVSLGFIKTRTKGSHSFYKHEDGRTTVIPFHINKTLPRPLLRAIINEIEITIDEFNKLI